MTDRAGILAKLAKMVASTTEKRHLAERLGEACRELLGVQAVSITVESATTNRVLLCATSSLATQVEELQDVLNEGPSWDAYTSGSAVVILLRADPDPRWSQFSAAGYEAVGSCRIIALPMRPGDSVLGVVSLYLPADGDLPEGMESAQFLADTLGAALLRDPAAYESPDGAGPWSGRSHVHQATGMVISQLGLSAADALAILRAHAYAHETTLDAIAQQVLDRTLDFGKDQT